ncbi:MAG: OB-fold nucleic acid binding domain-containing protein, partial [Methylophilaceae bacterium]|nr:OB-fold nucleic acid binding domain-containing protein [Methylophilaceae bacterium]
DCLANGIQVLPPDINRSDFRFTPLDERRILYGLGAIKGTGWAAIEVIMAAREQGGPFTDLFDFCRRIDLRKVNRRVIESLVRAGAFDSVDTNRAAVLATVGIAMEAAGQDVDRQDSLFGEVHDVPRQVMPRVAPWSERDKLAQEKAALGFYFSGHPFAAYKREISSFVHTELATLAPSDQPQLLAGVIVAVRSKITVRGKMIFVTLDDGTAQVEVAMGHEVWSSQQSLLKEDQVLVVEGKVSNDDYTGGLRVSARKVFDIAGARTAHARALKLFCNGQANAARLRALLTPYLRRNACPVVLEYRNVSARCEIALGDDWCVDLKEELLMELRDWLSEENVKILYH